MSGKMMYSLVNLAENYHALVMVADSYAVGFMGEIGRGTQVYCVYPTK